jgi:KDO2-lipid IV(A) lauroyltransferase
VLDALTVGGYRFGSTVASLMPASLAGLAAAGLGVTASITDTERRALVARNLRRADPTLRGTSLRLAVQQAFDSYARYWAESFRLPHLSAAQVAKGWRERGYHHVVEALEHGNGVILAMPHLGGWEWAGRWIHDQGHPVTAVVEAIEPPELFEWFRDLRSSLGMNVVPLGPEAGAAVAAALKQNHVVCLVSDRDIERNGVEVEFFGERTTLPAGAAALSLRTGAPLLPTAVYFTERPNGHLGVAGAPMDVARRDGFRADVQRITQDLAHEMERLIRYAPTQWHLMQPNWPSDPGYRR